jgi:iduronate 2-sulfatase
MNLHEEISRVPLMISVPGMQPGRTDALTELVDLYPTLAELVGITIPDEVQGKSVVPVLKDASAPFRSGALSIIPHKGIALRTKDFSYMRYRDGSEELYDMLKDPKQFSNHAANPEYAAVIQQLREQLELRLSAEGIGLDEQGKKYIQK